MQRNYQAGSKFKLTDDAVENYGAKYAGRVFVIREWFNHVGNDAHGHQGFDSSAGSAIYESDGMPFAVYEWEMVRA